MSYRQLATRPVLSCALAAIIVRLAVAMAPVALVYRPRTRRRVCAGLAATCAIGEVAGLRYSGHG